MSPLGKIPMGDAFLSSLVPFALLLVCVEPRLVPMSTGTRDHHMKGGGSHIQQLAHRASSEDNEYVKCSTIKATDASKAVHTPGDVTGDEALAIVEDASNDADFGQSMPGITWDYYKAGLMHSSDNTEEYDEILEQFQRFNAYRARTVVHLLCWALKTTSESCKVGMCQVNIMGSTNLGSDLDVSIISNIFDSGPVDIADKFNKKFLELFGMDSAAKFDTNIYCVAWFFIGLLKRRERCFATVECKNSTNLYHFKPVLNSDTHKVALAKLIYFYAILAQPAKSFRLDDLEKLKDVSVSNATTELFKGGMEFLEEITAGELDRRSMVFTVTDPTWHSESSKRNTKYVETSRELYDERWRTGGSCDELVHKAMVANAWGMETYWTEGAFESVVGVLQAGCTELARTIPPHLYLDSFLENVADVLKDLGHIKDSGDDYYEEVFIEAIKYLYRMFLARQNFLAESNLTGVIVESNNGFVPGKWGLDLTQNLIHFRSQGAKKLKETFQALHTNSEEVGKLKSSLNNRETAMQSLLKFAVFTIQAAQGASTPSMP